MTTTPKKRTPKLPLGLYRIQAVAKATGISEHALRVWERRYSVMASHRSEAGYRLYTDDDISRIRTIRELLDAGHAIGEIAALPVKDLLRLRKSAPSEVPRQPMPEPVAEVARKRFLDAIEGLDPEEAQRVIGSAMLAFAPFELVKDVVGPLLEEVGDRWRTGKFTVAQEHAASAVLRGNLGELLRIARVQPNAKVVVATTPEGELHEFGAMIAAVVAATAGARVLYLGPNLPAKDVAFAAKGSEASVAILSVVGMSEAAATEALTAIRKAVPRSVAVWAGGRALHGAPPSGVVFLASLEDLRSRILAL